MGDISDRLIDCPHCQQTISTESAVCPYCKKSTSPGPPKSSGFGAFLIVFLGLVGLAILLGALLPEDKKPEPKNINPLDVARYACSNYLNRALHDPDSAKLERPSIWFAKAQTDGTILVQPTGRAKNAFGAYINGAWDCLVVIEGNTTEVVSLKQILP